MSLALSVLLARVLRPTELGAYFTLVSIVAPAIVIGQLGLGPVAVRNVVLALETGKSAAARQVVQTTLRYSTLGITAIGGVVLLGGQMLGQPLALRLLLFAWAGLLVQQSLLADVLRGFKDFRAATLLGGVGGDLLNAMLLLGIWSAAGALTLTEVLPVLLVGSTLSVVLAMGTVAHKLAALPTTASPPPRLLSQAWPLLINNIGGLIFGQIDIWILTAFRPAAEVAIYGLASRLALVLTIRRPSRA